MGALKMHAMYSLVMHIIKFSPVESNKGSRSSWLNNHHINMNLLSEAQ